MDPNSPSVLTGTAYWLEHPFTGNPPWKVIALVLALFLIAIFFLHDGIRIVQENVPPIEVIGS